MTPPQPTAPIPRRVWLFTGGWMLAVGIAVVLKVWALLARAFDLGFFVQVLAVTARQGPFAATSLTGVSMLRDHFSPLLLPLAPLATTPWAPYGLVLVQMLVVGASIPAAWRLTGRGTADPTQRWLLTAGYATAPVLLFAVWNDFHASLLAAPFLVLLADAVESGEGRRALVFGLLAAAAREDMALLVLVVALLFWRSSPRYLGALAAGSVGFLVAHQVLSSGEGWFQRAGLAYVDLDAPLTTAATALSNAWHGAALLLLVLAWLLPWMAWGRLSARPVVAGLIFAAPYLVLELPHTKAPGLHYYFVMAVLGLWAVVRAGPQAWQTPRRRVFAASVLVVSVAAGPLGAGVLQDSVPTYGEIVVEAWTARSELSALHNWVDCLPDRGAASVATQVFPFVANRGEVFRWPSPLDDVVLRMSDIPIVEARPTQHLVYLVTPVAGGGAERGDSPSAEPSDLERLGVAHLGVSPGGWFELWASDPELIDGDCRSVTATG